MPQIDSNRQRRQEAVPLRGKRTISKRLIRARRARLHAILARFEVAR